MHFYFFITYNCVKENLKDNCKHNYFLNCIDNYIKDSKIGGAFMLSALCMTGICGFLGFLKSAVFVVRVYSRW